MDDSHLLGKMRHLKKEMLFVAEKLDARGNEHHGEEMRGAARVLETWIEGIRLEALKNEGNRDG